MIFLYLYSTLMVRDMLNLIISLHHEYTIESHPIVSIYSRSRQMHIAVQPYISISSNYEEKNLSNIISISIL